MAGYRGPGERRTPINFRVPVPEHHFDITDRLDIMNSPRGVSVPAYQRPPFALQVMEGAVNQAESTRTNRGPRSVPTDSGQGYSRGAPSAFTA